MRRPGTSEDNVVLPIEKVGCQTSLASVLPPLQGPKGGPLTGVGGVQLHGLKAIVPLQHRARPLPQPAHLAGQVVAQVGKRAVHVSDQIRPPAGHGKRAIKVFCNLFV